MAFAIHATTHRPEAGLRNLVCKEARHLNTRLGSSLRRLHLRSLFVEHLDRKRLQSFFVAQRRDVS